MCEVNNNVYLITAFSLKDTFEHYEADIASVMKNIQFDEEHKNDWKEYHMPDNFFRIILPTTPIYYQSANPPMSVMITDPATFPPGQFAVFSMTTEIATINELQHNVSDELSKVATILSEKTMTTNGMDAFEIQFKLGNETAFRRVFLKDNTVVMVTIAQPNDMVDEALTSRLLTKSLFDPSTGSGCPLFGHGELVEPFSGVCQQTASRFLDSFYFSPSTEEGHVEKKLSGAPSMSVEEYMPLAKNGDAAAQNELGKLYLNKPEPTEADYKIALGWFQKAADQGFIRAINNLGTLYEDGTGVEKNTAKAIQYYTQAAKNNLDIAQVNLARLHLNRKTIEDNLEAQKWLELAANQENKKAIYMLAQIYEDGLPGIIQTYKQADYWYGRYFSIP